RAPLCAVELDGAGVAVVANRMFEEMMGPLFKFAQFPFHEAAADEPNKARLADAIAAVLKGCVERERLRNVEMLALAGEAGLPVRTHFDWFIGPGVEQGHVSLYGDLCSEDIVAQREKDKEVRAASLREIMLPRQRSLCAPSQSPELTLSAPHTLRSLPPDPILCSTHFAYVLLLYAVLSSYSPDLVLCSAHLPSPSYVSLCVPYLLI
ncbi:MAG: hypothetical protein SGPRY_007400, partial [Prymnesium sp.]